MGGMHDEFDSKLQTGFEDAKDTRDHIIASLQTYPSFAFVSYWATACERCASSEWRDRIIVSNQFVRVADTSSKLPESYRLLLSSPPL